MTTNSGIYCTSVSRDCEDSAKSFKGDAFAVVTVQADSKGLQTVSGTGTSRQFLSSNGAGALPTWETRIFDVDGSGNVFDLNSVANGTGNFIASTATSGSNASNGIVIGTGSLINGVNSVALGFNSSSSGANSVAVGSSANTDQQGGVAIGNAATAAVAQNDVAIGMGATTTASYPFALPDWTTPASPALAVTHYLPVMIGNRTFRILLNDAGD